MEVVLKDGTVLQAADDADPAAVVKQFNIQMLKQQNPAEYDPESEEFQQKNAPVKYINAPVNMRGAGTGTAEGGGVRNTTMAEPSLENFRAGIGSGMVRTAKGLTNLVLPDSLTPEFASDENIREMDKRDKHLPASGQMIGSAVAGLPLSMGLGSGLGAATRLAGAGTKVGQVAASPLTRTLAEGASQGAVNADPDEQGEGALLGAAIGGGLHGLGKGGGRVLRGLVKKSEEAEALQQLAAQHGEDLFVPISQAGDESTLAGRLTKGFFKEALPIVPGVRGQMTKQADEAAEKMRELAIKEGLPEGVPVPGDVGKRPLESMDYIRDEFNKAYDDTVKSYAFNVPSDLKKQVKVAFQKAAGPKTTVNPTTLNKVADEVTAIVEKFSGGTKVLDGTNILNAKREISELIGAAAGHEKPGYLAADELLDDIIKAEMSQGGKASNLADLKKYLELTPAYRAFVPVRRAAQNARPTEGRFKFSQLADASAKSPEQQVLGQLGHSVLDKSPVSGGLVGKILAGVGFGGAGFGAFLDPVSTGLAIAGGNTLASKPAQRLLLGDTKFQRALAEALRKNPELKRKLGSLARAGVVSETRGDGDE